MRKLLILALLSCCFLSCGKQSEVVPYARVDVTVQINDPRYSLTRVGGYALVQGGVAGVIVYRRSQDAFVAYDRCSSYQPENKCAVNIDEVDIQVVDPCSGSKFLLSDGSPVKAPASRSLRAYIAVSNGFEIHVTN
ncbi:hypothetical protein GCM10023149_18420 [Mucilaginibacter gynuensis]|uniref:Nitrite reductase/ring-hydroxylating ferredoxin subunit n=1 Tax=Mucilaginibacter gynuensis TaxID=1302236 RepID=A0ABP8G8K8_9SPHI